MFSARVLRPGLMLLLAAAGAPPPAVVVASIEVRDVAPVQTYVGQVQAIQSVTVVARVDAYIDKVDFTEGSLVKSGDKLFELQKGPYQAALLQAQGQLQQAQATSANAEANYQRDAHAGVGFAVSEQQVQQDNAARGQATGQVTAARGNVLAAGINLGYTDVAAPIDGRIGKALITAGNFVGPTSGPLATIVQIDPIRVVFPVPDAQLIEIARQTGKTAEELAQTLALHLQLANGATYEEAGTIEFLNNQVDPSTGTVSVYGRFANPKGLLVPGAYLQVEVQRAKPDKHPIVPVQAVQNDKEGRFVLLVDAQNKVEKRTVTLGRQIGQDYIVQSGLTGGERVITDGVQKVQAGQVVDASTADKANASAPGGG